MKYKVGDKVKLNPSVEEFRNGKAGVNYGEVGEIRAINDEAIRINFPSHHCWVGYEEELIFAEKFEVGDTVRIRKSCTLGDLTLNNWNGCQIDTMTFLKQESYGTDFNRTYVVEKVTEKYLRVKGSKQDVNKIVFELVKRKETAKEMTLKEVCDALGYEVKIVKEGNDE